MEAKVVNVRFIGDATSVAAICAEARSAGWPLICHNCGDREAVIAGIVVADLIEEAWLLCTPCMRELISERIVH